jgi:hypothetical protein
VPAAGNQPAEERVLGRLGVEMERLRIVFACESLDRRLVERSRASGECLTDAEIIQIQGPRWQRPGFSHLRSLLTKSSTKLGPFIPAQSSAR